MSPFADPDWTHAKARRDAASDQVEEARTLEVGVRNLAEDLRRRTTDHLVERYGVPYYSGPWVAGQLEKLLSKGGA